MPTTALAKPKAPGRTTSLKVEPPGKHASKPAVSPKFIKWFADIGIEDVPLVGGKNASLGEMFRELTSKSAQWFCGDGGGVSLLPARGGTGREDSRHPQGS